MARLTGGKISLGSVSKNIRYIAGGKSEYRDTSFFVPFVSPKPEVRVIKKRPDVNRETMLKVSIGKNDCSFILDCEHPENYQILYSSSNKLKDAIEYKVPISFQKYWISPIFVWVVDGSSLFATYCVTANKKETLVRFVPEGESLEAGSFDNLFDDNLITNQIAMPRDYRQDLSKFPYDIELISKPIQFLFRKDFMNRLYSELDNPSDVYFDNMLQEMSAKDIMEMINVFKLIFAHG